MTENEFYYAIGNIDDDLIIEAMEYTKSKSAKYKNKFIAIAACFVMIGVIINITEEDVVNVNDMEHIINSYSMPLDDYIESNQYSQNDNIVKIFSEESMVKYLGINGIPKTLSKGIVLSDQNTYRIIENSKGEVTHDNFEIIYTDYDKKFVTINLSKSGKNYGDMFNSIDNLKVSEIKDVFVTIGKFGETEFGAEFKNDIYYTINSEGVNEKEFISILESIINSQK